MSQLPQETYDSEVKSALDRQDKNTLTKLIVSNRAIIDRSINEYDESATVYAARKGLAWAVKLLIEHGANINYQNKDGWTALHTAAHRDHFECVKLLVEAGANHRAKSKWGETAAMKAKKDDIKVYLQNLDRIESGWMFACRTRDFLEIQRMLRETDNVGVNEIGMGGNTALHFAAKVHDVKLYEFLVNKGADASIKNNEGKTAPVLLKEAENLKIPSVQRDFDGCTDFIPPVKVQPAVKVSSYREKLPVKCGCNKMFESFINMRKQNKHVDLIISTSDNRQVLAHSLLVEAKDPDFYNMLVSINNSQPNITVRNDSPGFYNTGVMYLKDYLLSFFTYYAAPGSYEALGTAQQITVTETAPVMEAIMTWLYEDCITEDPEALADIYRAARKYQLTELCGQILKQIRQLKNNAQFIVNMTSVALELKDEDLIRRLIFVLKANKSLRKVPEFQTLLNKHGMQLIEYFMEC